MGGLRDKVIGLVALVSGSASAGCTHTNMQAMGLHSPAPYTDLECNEPGNPEGFSFRIPACECNGGIRMRYRITADRHVRYEYEAGTNTEETVDDAYVVLLPDGTPESVSVAGVQRPLDGSADDGDTVLIKMALDSAVMMWENYSTLTADFDSACAEERNEDALDRLGE
jgi:hypothetical protein